MNGTAGSIIRILLIGILCISASLFVPVYAATPARIEDTLQILITADDAITTQTEFQLTLRNTGSTTILTDYYLNVGALPLRDISLVSKVNGLSLRYEAKTNNNQLHFRFGNRTLKKGDSVSVRVRSSIQSLWEKKGSIQVMRLPFQLSGFSADSRIVTKVNRQLGTLLFSNQPYSQANIEGNYTVYSFPLDGVRSASFAFGKEQVYSVFTTYDLENTSATAQEQQIIAPALRMSNFRTTVDAINPLPTAANTLQDGNARLVYLLQTGEKKRVALNYKFYLNNEQLAKVALSADQQSAYRTTSGILTLPIELQRKVQASTVLAGNRPASEQVAAVTQWLTKNYSLSTTAQQQFAKREYLRQHSLAEVIQVPNGRIVNAYEATLVWLVACRLKSVPCRLVYGVVYSYISTNARASAMQVWGQYYDSSLERWVDVDPLLAMATGLPAHNLELTHIPLFELEANTDPSSITKQYYEATVGAQAPTVVEEVSVEASSPQQSETKRRFWDPLRSSVTVTLVNNGNTPAEIKKLDFLTTNLNVSWEYGSYNDVVLYPGARLSIPVQVEIAPRLTPSSHQVTLVGEVRYAHQTATINKPIQLSQTGDATARVVYSVVLTLVAVGGILILLVAFRLFNKWFSRRQAERV